MDSVLELANAELVKSAMILLDRVCWKTETGQHWAVLGPDGTGRVLPVRVASGRLSLNRGNVTLDSQDLKGVDPAELATWVALVSKSSTSSIRDDQGALDLMCTAAWGISVHRGGECKTEDEARCQDLLEIFGIPHPAQCELRILSEGETRRALPARSLMSNPEVLILGESDAGLDLEARELFLSALEEVMSGTRASQVVLVIHQMEDIPAGITHAATMARGRITVQGPIDKTLTGVNLSHVHELLLSAGCDAGRWRARGLKRS